MDRIEANGASLRYDVSGSARRTRTTQLGRGPDCATAGVALCAHSVRAMMGVKR